MKPDWESGFKTGLGVRFLKSDWESGFKTGLGVRFLTGLGVRFLKPDWESGFKARLGPRFGKHSKFMMACNGFMGARCEFCGGWDEKIKI